MVTIRMQYEGDLRVRAVHEPSDRDLVTDAPVGSPGATNDWLSERDWPIATVHDMRSDVAQAIGIISAPTWILVGADGVVTEVVDAHHVTAEDVMAQIAALAE